MVRDWSSARDGRGNPQDTLKGCDECRTSNDEWRMSTDRWLGLLIGLLAGMFLCCAVTGLVLALGGGSPASQSATIPPGATLDVAVDEAYLSRTLAQNARGYPSPWPVVGGRMDARPGNQATFDVLVDSPAGQVKVSGRATFAAVQGRLVIRIAEVKLGAIPVTPLASVFAPNLDAQINAKANQQLQERTAGAGVTLLGVTTDEQFLRLYFTGQ